MTTSAPCVFDRRAVLRLFTGSIGIAVAGAVLRPDAASAGALRTWCRLDPAFRVDGLVGNVYVSGLIDVEYDTTGPIRLTFVAPTGCQVELLSSDPGFGYGYEIAVAYSDKLRNDDRVVGLEVEVLVPAVSDKLPILVEFVPEGAVTVADARPGMTNRPVRVRTELAKPWDPAAAGADNAAEPAGRPSTGG